jgi:phage terminase large subunit
LWNLRDARLQGRGNSEPGLGRRRNAHRRLCARIFHKCSSNAKKCEAGIEALGFCHEKKDEQRDVGLGPEHDWSSHAADAFGLMAIAYEEPSRLTRFNRKIEYPQLGIV